MLTLHLMKQVKTNILFKVPNLALQTIKGEKLWLEDSSEQYAHDNFDPYCDEV